MGESEGMQTRRHAPLGRQRARFVQSALGRRRHTDLHLGRLRLADIFTRDHSDIRRSGHFRWLLSTSLAAAVGLIAIAAIVTGSSDTQQNGLPRSPYSRVDGLRWAIPKTDRLLIPSGVVAARFDIPDVVRQHRDGRDYILEKTYHRLVARLAPISKAQAEAIPRLDPITLYADITPLDQTRRAQNSQQNGEVRVVQLLSGTVASEDGQELDMQEVVDLVARMLGVGEHQPAMHPGFGPESARPTPGELLAERASPTAFEVPPPNTSILEKSVFEADDTTEDPAQVGPSSLYASLHHAAQRLDIPPEVIVQILKIHAYATDFSQSVRAGDSVEFFFEGKKEGKGRPEWPGELLATAITSRRETHKFYRFRTPDGVVDYYDEGGSTSRTFLMRQPVRCPDVRVASGFGMRTHPLLQVLRPHTGVDWACAAGTPIMAAGNGVIEEAGRRGEYGNYLRIRHANGYKTIYGHMAHFAPGAGNGVKVRQGQIIGYVGNTGFSSGAHVHFEVLVANGTDNGYRHVDPLSIHVPQERQLAGKDLADFRKEQVRIAKLMSRNPISTRVATARH
jgi:murein DD-endopeptidase MepM/ murein hydrolase activator NlpD